METNSFHGIKLVRCRLQRAGIDHGGLSAAADHCTHDGEHRGQCQT